MLCMSYCTVDSSSWIGCSMCLDWEQNYLREIRVTPVLIVVEMCLLSMSVAFLAIDFAVAVPMVLVMS